MKSYAECVQYLYPDPVSPESVPFIKAGIIVLLVAMVVGFWFGRYRADYGDWLTACLMAILFPLVAVMVGLVLFGVAAGVMYVLS